MILLDFLRAGSLTDFSRQSRFFLIVFFVFGKIRLLFISFLKPSNPFVYDDIVARHTDRPLFTLASSTIKIVTLQHWKIGRFLVLSLSDTYHLVTQAFSSQIFHTAIFRDQSDKTMANKLIYIPNDAAQDYPIVYCY